MRHIRGFTLIEVMITITLVALAAALLINVVNYQDMIARSNADKLVSDFASISTSANNYYADKGIFPSGLNDNTFVPIYLFTPRVPQNFDETYGAYGYFLGQQSGHESPDNGYYLCARVPVTGATDTNWLAAMYIGQRLSPTKYFYSTSCPAISNMSAPTSPTTVYYTFWLTRS